MIRSRAAAIIRGIATERRVLLNVAFAGLNQFANYGLALATVPVLAYSLLTEGYGVFAVSLSVNAFLWLIVDWGFNSGATLEAAKANGDPARLAEIFYGTHAAKLVLAGITAVGFLALGSAGAVPHFEVVALPGVMCLIGSACGTDWFFQGIQRMGYQTVINLASRAVLFGCLALLVHSPENIRIACNLQGAVTLGGSLVGFFAARNLLKGARPGRLAVWTRIADNRHYFFITSAWIVYASAAPVVLAFVSTTTQVGLFAGAEKVSRAVASMTAPLAVALFPRINALVDSNPSRASRIAAFSLSFQLFYGLAVGVALFAFAPQIVGLVLGPQFAVATIALRIIAPFPLLVGLNGVLANQFLVPLGYKSFVARTAMAVAGVYLVVLVILALRFGAPGGAASLVVAEALSSLILAAGLWRRRRDYILLAFRAKARDGGA